MSIFRITRARAALVVAVTMCAAAAAAAAATTHHRSTAAEAKVGVILKTYANEYWTAMRDGAKAAGKKYGVEVRVDAAASESATQEQVAKAEAMVSGGYNCMAVAPITGTNLVQSMVTATKKDIYVVNLDSAIDAKAAAKAGVPIETTMSSNNSTAGRMAAKEMARLLGKKAKGAQIALAGGIAGNLASNQRIGGFRAGAKAAGLKIVQFQPAEWDRLKALNYATDVLRARPNIAGFFAANDGMALGIYQAIANAKKAGKVFVIGVDGTSESLKSIKAGRQSATVAQSPYTIGYMGVEACIARVAGKTLPKHVDSPVLVINKNNAAKALSVYPKPVKQGADPYAALIR